MGIIGGNTSTKLYGCLDEELKRYLQKSNQGVQAASMTEVVLMAAINKLFVKEESN